MSAPMLIDGRDVRSELESKLRELSREKFIRWYAKGEDDRVVVCASKVEIPARFFGPNWITPKENFQYKGVTFYRGEIYKGNPGVRVRIGDVEHAFPYSHFDQMEYLIGEQCLRLGSFMRETPQHVKGLRGFAWRLASRFYDELKQPLFQIPSFDE